MATVEILLDRDEKEELEEIRNIVKMIDKKSEDRLLGFIEGVKISRLLKV